MEEEGGGRSGSGRGVSASFSLGGTHSRPFTLVKHAGGKPRALNLAEAEEDDTDEEELLDDVDEEGEEEEEEEEGVVDDALVQEHEDSSGDEDEDDEDDDEDDSSGGLSLSLSLSSRSFMTRLRHEEESYFSLLPAELRLNIFSFLCPSQLARIRLVSQQWREVAEDDRLWRALHQERLGGPLVLKYSKNPIRKQVERDRRKEEHALKQKEKKRKKEWADKRKRWLRKEKTKHREGENQYDNQAADTTERFHRRDELGAVNVDKQAMSNFDIQNALTTGVPGDQAELHPRPSASDTATERTAATNADIVRRYAMREGVLYMKREERSVASKDKELKDFKHAPKSSPHTEPQHEGKWIEGYWAFGKYMKKLAYNAQAKEKGAQRKQDPAKKPADANLLAILPPSTSHLSPLSNTAGISENMRMRQYKALEEKEKRKEKREKREAKEKEKREKRARSLSDSRKEKDKKPADKIEVYGRILKRERSRTTDDIVPAVVEAKARDAKLAAAEALSKRSNGAIQHRQRSSTVDYGDRLASKQKEQEIEAKEKKAKAKLEKKKEKAQRREVDFCVFWDNLTRSTQAWVLMTAASFGHRTFLERLYATLKENKTAARIVVPIYHQLLHAACQQGQLETADLLLLMKQEFQSDRRITLSPAYKHMELQLQVARWDAFRTASKWGHTKLIELLLSHGYQPDERAVRGAIVGGQLDILKLLISYGADIKPIHMKRAIYYRNRDIVAHLLESFPHLPRAEPYLLKIAVSTRSNFRHTERLRNRTIPKYVDFDIVDLLLEHGADINDNSDIHYAPSPLHIAAQQGDPDLCEYLIRRGADLYSNFSCPPYAVANPLLHKIRGLVLTLTPFEVAIYNGRERVVEFFLARATSSLHPLTELSKLFCKPEPKKQPKGANLLRPYKEVPEITTTEADAAGSPRAAQAKERPRLTTILHQPEELSQVPNIKNIFKIFRMFKVNFKEIESHVVAYLPALSPLHIAAKNDSHSGILAMLIELNFNREKRDKKGRTPLLKAARFCAVDNIDLLLRHHVVFDSIDCDGNCVFHHLVNSLPSASGTPSNSSPTSIAAPRSPAKIRAANPAAPFSVPSPSPSSASSTASSSGSDSVVSKIMNAVQILMQAGADINMINNFDETCLDLLLRKSKKSCPGRNDLALFLKTQGAKSGKELVQTVKSKGKLRGLLGL